MEYTLGILLLERQEILLTPTAFKLNHLKRGNIIIETNY